MSELEPNKLSVRLRNEAEWRDSGIMYEAADEIDRLKAENAKLKQVLNDASASANLATYKSYSMFDEPCSVRKAREILSKHGGRDD